MVPVRTTASRPLRIGGTAGIAVSETIGFTPLLTIATPDGVVFAESGRIQVCPVKMILPVPDEVTTTAPRLAIEYGTSLVVVTTAPAAVNTVEIGEPSVTVAVKVFTPVFG